MSYKFYSLCEAPDNEWEMVYSYLLNKSDYFKIERMYPYEYFVKAYPDFINNNNLLESFSISNSFFTGDKPSKRESWKKLFLFSIEKSNLFRIQVPIIKPFQSLIDSITNIPYVTITYPLVSEDSLVAWAKQFEVEPVKCEYETNKQKYIEMYGQLTTELKFIIKNSEIFNILQIENMPEWKLYLICDDFYRSLFSNWKHTFCTQITIEELEFLSNTLVSTEDLDTLEYINTMLGQLKGYTGNHHINGILNEESKLMLTTVPCTSRTLSNREKLTIPCVILYKENREILHRTCEDFLICLSELELEEIKTDLNIDISNWYLYKEKDRYDIPNDYFILELANP